VKKMSADKGAMKALQVQFNAATQAIDTIENASPESWGEVCERFDNDVHRIMDLSDPKDYTALYACYDENNQPVYYMVEEGEALLKMRHKVFLGKLGQPLT
jgi:hypothetical protein